MKKVKYYQEEQQEHVQNIKEILPLQLRDVGTSPCYHTQKFNVIKEGRLQVPS